MLTGQPAGREHAILALCVVALCLIRTAAAGARLCMYLHAGASKEDLAKAAAEEAAWLEFQRSAAWWLGEYANVAADEFAGQGPKTVKGGVPGEEIPSLGLSAGEVVALKALRNPHMAAVVSHLHHAVFTLPWVTRIAATQAIAKVGLCLGLTV